MIEMEMGNRYRFRSSDLLQELAHGGEWSHTPPSEAGDAAGPVV